MEAVEKMKAWPKATRDYVNELKLEMRRVTWPSRKQVEGTTGVVIVAVFLFAAYFAIIDALLNDSIVRLHTALTR
jgi:preprotein translocase subunit SecE